MRRLLSPIFALKLIISALPSLFSLAINQLKPYRSLIISLFFFFFTVLVFKLQPSPPPAPSPQSLSKTQTTLKIKRQKLEAFLQNQPNHRDILYNLAQINFTLNNKEVAEKYLQQARQLDPNHKIFEK